MTVPSVYTVTEFLSQSSENIWGAVLGRPIEHSRSPLIHNAAAQRCNLAHSLGRYVPIEAGEKEELQNLLAHCPPTVRGFSVTMPGKIPLIEVVDSYTDRVRILGSANTAIPYYASTHDDPDESRLLTDVSLTENLRASAARRWKADNTDVDGIHSCLDSYNFPSERWAEQTAIIVGNGGTARPALLALSEKGVSRVAIIARSYERAQLLRPIAKSLGIELTVFLSEERELISAWARSSSVVINTIPDHAVAPLADILLSASAVLDIIYDPYPTTLISEALKRGIPVADGLQMLAGQAEKQFHYFTGVYPPEGFMLDILQSDGV